MIKNNTKIWVAGMSEAKKKQIQDAAFKAGFEWFAVEDEYRHYNDDVGAYYFEGGDKIYYSSAIDGFHFQHRSENVEIFWKDIINEFTLDDLEDGMVVEFRNGQRSLVLKTLGVFVTDSDGFMKFESYNQDLKLAQKSCIWAKYDIVKVLRNGCQNPLSRIKLPTRDTEVVWERKDSGIEDQKRELVNKIDKIEQQLNAAKERLVDLEA